MEYQHGLRDYQRGCRCADCCEAWALYMKHVMRAKSMGMPFSEYKASIGITGSAHDWVMEQLHGSVQTSATSKPFQRPVPVNL